MSKQPLRSRPPAVLSALGVLALVAALGVVEIAPAPASETPPPAAARPAAAWHAAYAVPPANWMDSVGGSQTRMLQVGLVVIAIGVFLLSRSVR